MPFFEDGRQPVSWDCEHFLDGISDDFAYVDWDHPEIDDVTLRIAFLLKIQNNIVCFDN